MPSPIVPDDIKNTISSPTATLCGNFTNTILKLPTYLYQIFNWMFTPTGAVSDEFKREIIPAGMIMPAAFATVPDGWLLCDGQELIRDDYPELFTAIGILYGSSLATTFKVPDYRGRFLVGAGPFTGSIDTSHETAVLGTTGGEDKVQLSIAQSGLAHTHPVGRFMSNSGDAGDNTRLLFSDVDLELDALPARDHAGAGNYGLGTIGEASDKYIVTGDPINPADGEPVEPDFHNNLPPYHPVNYFIKI